MLIDSHAHLNFKAFKNDLNQVIGRCRQEDISVINVGSNYETSKRAIEIAEKNDGMYAVVGLHPIHAREELNIKELCQSNKVVAIGEIGLDYFKDYALFKDKQKDVFLKQLDLAKELDLPVVLHCRMAHEDLLKILKEHRTKNNEQLGGVVHCFTGGWKEAEKYLDKGLYLGFNGIMYKFDLKEVIKKTPLNRMLVETDCPYLTPLPAVTLVKASRNEPIFIKYIVEEIAKIKGISFQEVASATVQNTKKLFKI